MGVFIEILKEYKRSPSPKQAVYLSERFDDVFQQKKLLCDTQPKLEKIE
jgi:hypothetical protein